MNDPEDLRAGAEALTRARAAAATRELRDAFKRIDAESRLFLGDALDTAQECVEAAERIRSLIKSNASAVFTPSPPRAGEFLIGLFCTRGLREAIVGDLAEKFQERAATSTRRARAWYWFQVVRSFGAFGWGWVRRLAELDAIFQRIGF